MTDRRFATTAAFRELIDAVTRIETIDRARCRRHALAGFSAAKMADGYERVYAHMTGRNERQAPVEALRA